MSSIKGRYIGLLYVSPWIAGFLVFQLYPFVMSFFYSFTDFSLLKPPRLIGLKNFVYMFTRDKDYYQSLKVTLIYGMIAVPMKLAFALLVAMILNLKLRYINVFRTFYYLPSILGGSVAIAILWRFLFNRSGVVNEFLAMVHLGPVDWLGSDRWALFTLSLLTVWQFGSSMVIFLAGLKQVPADLYEAAKVDGAGRLRVFFKVTLPLITPMIFFNLILQMIYALQEFTGPYVITGGGPLKSTYLYALMLYDNAFSFLKMGYASAQSWVLFAIIIVFTALIFKSSPYWTFYQDEGAGK
ncbi:MAG TPA: sugar ABC transporter permease [Spirochaetia bacterium]|nr:sugar ABC transporter permease [Spirochaetia bacterium]